MSPTLSVHSETFLPLLTSIDDNMLYLTKHPEYRESAAHLTKFRACLSRALEMVRSHVRRVLDAATAAASEPNSHSSDPQPLAPSHTAFTLFYGKFRAAAPRVRGLIQEVEEREVVEYKGLLADLENHYLDCRLSLLQPSVQSAVQQLLQVPLLLLFLPSIVFISVKCVATRCTLGTTQGLCELAVLSFSMSARMSSSCTASSSGGFNVAEIVKKIILSYCLRFRCY